MAPPPVYLDECVHYDLVEALRKRGFFVTCARDEGATGSSDPEQLSFAASHGWLLVTYNADDFRKLHRAHQLSGQSHAGIMVIPQHTRFRVLELRTAMLLDWIGTHTVYYNELFRWGQLQELLERGQRIPGYTESDVGLVLGR